MIFFGRGKKAGPSQPKGPSILGTLFLPNVRSTIRPIGEGFNVFTMVIAMIFAANGLFPKDHPGLKGDPNARLTLKGILNTAWSGLSFTADGMPKVLLFFAVVSCFVLTALIAVTVLLSLLVGSAHAEGFGGDNSSFFRAERNDVAQSWIDYLFRGIPLPEFSATQPQFTTTIQRALTTALAFYSNAILIVAAVILFYHLVSMVVETAHHGVAMGKRASQIWAPIRLVVAIGLLVPVSGGLNCGQYIVIQIASWGSGLASRTWDVFTQSVFNNPNVVVPPAPYVEPLVANLILMEACKSAYNVMIDNETNGSGQTYNFDGFKQKIPGFDTGPFLITKQEDDSVNGKKISYSNAILHDKDICGAYTRFKPDSTDSRVVFQEQISQAHITAFDAIQPRVEEFAQKSMTYFQAGYDNFGKPFPDNGEYTELVKEYQVALQEALVTAVQRDQQIDPNLQQAFQQEGWASAGAYFNTVARIAAEVRGSAQEFLPIVTPPKSVFITEDVPEGYTGGPRAKDIYDSVAVYLDGLQKWLRDGKNNSSASATATKTQLLAAMVGLKPTGDAKVRILDIVFAYIDFVASWNRVWKFQLPTALQDSILGVTIKAQNLPVINSGTLNGIQNENFQLAVQFQSTNPLAEIADLGHANLQTAYTLFDQIVGLEILSGGTNATALASIGPQGQALGEAGLGGLGDLVKSQGGGLASGIASVISLIALVFFIAGFALAFMLPLLPFLIFFFGTLSWVASLLEAVICMPLVALAHLNPEGEGLPGSSAKAAYFFIFSIFLRPVLMIFGLAAGLLLFYIAASFMNKMYAIAVVGSGGISHGQITLARLVYSITYVTILYTCANNAFKLITWIPDHALQWIGASALPTLTVGDAQHLETVTTGIVGYAGNQLFQNAGSAARNLAPAAGASTYATPAMEKYKEVYGQTGDVGKALAAAGKTAADLKKAGKAGGAYTGALGVGGSLVTGGGVPVGGSANSAGGGVGSGASAVPRSPGGLRGLLGLGPKPGGGRRGGGGNLGGAGGNPGGRDTPGGT